MRSVPPQTRRSHRAPWLLFALPILALMAVGTCGGDSGDEDRTMSEIRHSVLAGAWYDANPQALAAAVDKHLAKGRPLEEVARARPVALIAPHAGHQWSGDAAGHAYRLLEGAAGRDIRRVILLGPSHSMAFRGASLLQVAAYETPLGEVPLDREVVAALLAHPLFQTRERAHSQEHCLEIQLPFLQRVLIEEFRIVPIIVSQLPPPDWKTMAAAIAPHVDEHTILVISTDFTHFGYRFGYLPFRDDVDENLRRLDKGALLPILALDPPAFAEYKEKTDITVCGFQPIGILLELMRHPDLVARWGGSAPAARILEYYRSADLTGDFDGSVSYAAVGFFRTGDLLAGPDYPPLLASVTVRGEPAGGDAGGEGARGDAAGNPGEEDAAGAGTPDDATMVLSAAEKKYLLELARRTVEEIVTHQRVVKPAPYPAQVSPEKLESVSGVFVTLTSKGRLRGCIGSIVGTDPLVNGVIENAISAATRDPRFPPVAVQEIPDLAIEISVLTPLRRVDGFEQIVVGRHGVVLERSGRRAVFLPQVAPEQGWNRETMLDHLAAKAGLPRDAWREAGTTFQVFEALVFSEEGAH